MLFYFSSLSRYPKFRENAAPDVIVETEAQAANRAEEQTRLQTALTRLQEIG